MQPCYRGESLRVVAIHDVVLQFHAQTDTLHILVSAALAEAV